MNKAEFVFHGTPMSIVSPDIQMLQAGVSRFSSSQYVNAMREIAPSPFRRILDVGASIGYYTMIFHYVWPEAEIWSIEPSSVAFQYLMINTAHFPNVRHFNLAAGEGTYSHTMAMPTYEQKSYCNIAEGNLGIMSMFGESNINREEVHVVKLDDLIDWCDLIKVDVEGYEQKVVEGASRLLKEARPVLHVEFVKQNRELSGMSGLELQKLIESFGYKNVYDCNQDKVFWPKEKVNAIYSRTWLNA